MGGGVTCEGLHEPDTILSLFEVQNGSVVVTPK